MFAYAERGEAFGAWFNSSTVGATIGGLREGTHSVAFRAQRNATGCVPYRIRPGKCYPGLSHAAFGIRPQRTRPNQLTGVSPSVGQAERCPRRSGNLTN